MFNNSYSRKSCLLTCVVEKYAAVRQATNDNIPYILESNPHPNRIRTSFCRFLKRKKKKS